MLHAEMDTSDVAERITSLPPLFVNDGQLPQSRVGILRQSSAEMPDAELRRRYDEDGYLFLKSLLPRDDVLTARRKYFEFLRPTALLKPGTQPVDGIFDHDKDRSQYPGIGAGATGGNGHPGDHASIFVNRALEAHYQPWYSENLCKHPKLRDFVARLTRWGGDTLGFERTLLRNNVPGNKAIGVHYDQYVKRTDLKDDRSHAAGYS